MQQENLDRNDRIAFLISVAVIVLVLSLLAGCAPSVVKRAVELDPNTAYVPTEGDEMGSALKLLVERLEEGGYTVDIASPEAIMMLNQGERAYGLHFRGARRILLNSEVPINAQFETLAHEAGHAFHSPVLQMESYGAAEVFAELVGSRVQEFYGSKSARLTSSDYLARFKHNFAMVKFLQADMDKAVEVLTGKRAWAPLTPPEEQ